MSVEYCEHNYPVPSSCPGCELAEVRAENEQLRVDLVKARGRAKQFAEAYAQCEQERNSIRHSWYLESESRTKEVAELRGKLSRAWVLIDCLNGDAWWVTAQEWLDENEEEFKPKTKPVEE